MRASSAETFRTLARYNRWMNQRLYAVCAELPDAERRRDRGAFFRSIHGTLNHGLLADHIWLARFRGGTFAFGALDDTLHEPFDELRAAREAADAETLAWAGSLTDEGLAATLRYTSVVRPRPRAYPLWVAATHFFNHQTHHRGQLTALLSQSGCDYGVTDLIWMPGTELPGD